MALDLKTISSFFNDKALSTAYEAVEIHQGIQVWLEGHGGVLKGARELLALRALLPLPMEL
ncbi:MAG: hypothetical protein HA491_05340 [Candidatus Verstraetearchaeota archaeon]|nr:hypothetical protein [Candidatus Verstraetearchaeota archaeon]